MKTCYALLAILLGSQILMVGQDTLPFSQYPVTSRFKGTPVPARPITAFARRYRTVIRRGAADGPNFAGHYTVVFWGCGTACAQFVIVDAETGNVFDPPYRGVSFEAPQGGFFQQSGIHYQLNSSLLVVQGCPEDKDCAEHLYNWTGDKLEPVGTKPLTPLEPR